jgi:hypothetical protein
MTVFLTYKQVQHFITGAFYGGIAGVEDKSDGTKSNPFKNAEIGEPVVMYSSEVHAVVGIGRVTSSAYRDESLVWKDGLYPNRLGIELIAFDQDGVPLKDIQDFIGKKNLVSLYNQNSIRRTSESLRITEYIFNRFNHRT